MLPYIVAVASILVVGLSLYKEQKTSPNSPFIKHAVWLHHVGQAVLVALAFWAAVDSTNSAKKVQVARLYAEAAAAAHSHSSEILEKYMLGLLPHATVLKNHKSYQQGLLNIPSEVAGRFNWDSVASSKDKESLVEARRAFADLQRVARKVLNERLMYGEKYPEAMATWATRTLDVEVDALPELLLGTPAAQAYTTLIGEATGVSVKKYQDAAARLSQ
ncbi:hypothetical protein SB816_08330 [Achromobacter sp. SIMBA_011]|uniref:hypothetical protein n=2 Tax=Pseudomonadota TaxID=1224 RepID=UPI003979A2CE